ncbi:MAG: cupin domain-containing protein [Chloroflexi bacterium]|nr:cupin domain-containing protein [Chloroflexota bacterium]
MTPEFLIRHFHLEPLPREGGMFARYYLALETVAQSALPARYIHAKNFGSAICYLHQPHTQSFLHKLKTDEIYHFYAGDPVALVMLHDDGSHHVVILGQDYRAGQHPFFVVPRGVWQGSCLVKGGAWALLGATLAPAYDDDDFELGERAVLLSQYPTAADWVRRLTPEPSKT